MSSNIDDTELLNAVAIIGMSGRFPGARNVEEYWRNLRDGVETITFFAQPEKKSGCNGHAAADSPLYVGAKGILSDIELFDATFFGFNPRDAEITDPQHRFFLECAWEALERAGYDPKSYDGSIAVYAGVSMSSYLVNLYSNSEIKKAASSFQLHIANDKDHLPTRVSYKLNLRGPSVSVQTACSTSLVAVHLACHGLLSYQCDIALGGGASIVLPQDSGYFYQEDGILSPDGHCRAFDAKAQGTVCGNGVGVVVLKRFEDALRDRDFIHAIIRGSAFNNDGSSKVGYTAPSVSGQAEVIAMAQALAGVSAESISYVETHGTGTTLGDPIEIKALTQAFRASTKRRKFCAIGSVKTNIGHLDAAAGVAGLIKTTLALENKMIPPSLHFEQPNPEINFEETPFYVNKDLSNWEAGPMPRRAGVSSFGIGGTNAHIVLEEAPRMISKGSAGPFHLLTYSAKTAAALEKVTHNLCEHLRLNPDADLADVAFTLQSSRSSFAHRRVAICSDVKDAIATLSGENQQRLLSDCQETRRRPLAFMFSGQGSQYVNMGRELYQNEPLFREKIDQCSKLVAPHIGFDLRRLLYPEADADAEAKQKVNETSVAQPLLFAVEFALASLLIGWGAKPDSMIGHSIGEYVAACLAGVFSLEDALALVAKRGKLMQSLPKGAMVSVALGESEVRPLLAKGLSLAAVNAPSLCVVSGSKKAIEDFEKALEDQKIITRRLHTSHAFHSEMMEPILDSFARSVKSVRLNAPQMPFISNVTGTWIKPDEATDPEYWITHVRNIVRFADGVRELLKADEPVLVEIGPGRTLSTFAKQQVEINSNKVVFNLLPAATDEGSDAASFLKGLGRLWLSGLKVNWAAFNAKRRGHRIPLPTYPFERQRYWVEPSKQGQTSNGCKLHLHKKADIKDWFYVPAWARASEARLPFEYSIQELETGWIVFLDDSDFGERIVRRLEKENHSVVTVRKGDCFAQTETAQFVIDAASEADYDRLVQAAWSRHKKPGRVIHLWSVTTDDTGYGFDQFQQAQQDGLMSLLFFAQALSKNKITDPLKVDIISNNIHEITGDERLCPERATVIAACKVIPQEYTKLKVRNIDLNFEDESGKDLDKLAGRVMSEIVSNTGDPIVAYRGRFRWVQTFEQVKIDALPQTRPMIRPLGVYLITGGLGAIGLTIAEHLATIYQAKIILVGRTPLRDKAALERVKAMEDAGAEVLVCCANAADEHQMEAVIARAYEAFGELNGVIHAAGAEHQKSVRAIQETELYDLSIQFEPKVKALFVLEKILRGRRLDFCLLQSSLSAILGGLGFYAYAAANIFMDAFAVKQNREGAVPWISANWDGWHMSKAKTNGDLGISPGEGVAALAHILAINPLPQVIISTGNLQQRIDQWIKLEHMREDKRDAKQEITLYPRPALQSNYTAPRTEIEQNIIEMWTQLLGIDRIGIHDNFFDLGGHSLLAIQLISRLRDNYHVELPLRSLFETPTVSDLVISILARQAEQADSDLLAQVLVEMGHVPGDEAHLTLTQE